VTAMRAPVVAGVGGGVGTTTVAVALRGHDRGATGRRFDGLPDILVCRGTLDSVRRAAAVLDEAGTDPPPVLAVTLAGRAPRGPLRGRLELLEADVAALVLLPHVRRWCTLADPLAEAARLLVEPAAQLPRPLRAYAAALRELVAAVAASGRLARDPSGEPARPPDPRYSDEWPARRIGSVERPVRHERRRPAVVGAFRPVDGPAPRAASRAFAAAATNGPATGGTPPLGTGPQQPRRGVRIVAPQLPRGARGAPAERVERVG